MSELSPALRGICGRAASYGKDVPLRVRRDEEKQPAFVPMKITPLLAASLLALAPLAVAQSPQPAATPIAPVPSPAPAAPAVWKLPVFNSPADKLKTVVEALQQILEKQKFERMNILISSEAEAAKVPALDLRNVSGPDALSLIASAASCLVEPIPALGNSNGEPIGYKLRPAPGASRREKPWAPDGKAGGMPSAALPTPSLQIRRSPIDGRGPSGIPGLAEETGAGVAPSVGFNPFQQAEGELVGGNGVAFFGGGADAGAGIGGMSPGPVIQTRVYPLGTVGASATFAEIEKTLDEVLATSGAPKEQVKLALHDKTNVLVVRGPAEAQAMVEQLLAALGKNNAGNGDRDATSQITTMTVRLEAMTAEMDRLRKQIAEVEAERRELEKEKRKSEDERRELEKDILKNQAPQKSDRR